MVSPISDRLRKAFHRLGLTDYEMRVYVALLENGGMTANQISEIAGVPYSKIYEILESLEEKGWIRSEGGRPAKFHPQSPTTALEINRLRITRELKKYESVLMSELLPMYEGAGMREKQDIWILRGELNMLSKLRSLLSNCDMELQLASPWISKELIDILLPTLIMIKNKGGKAQILLSRSASKSLARRLSEHAEVRLRDQMFGGGVISDSKEAIIILGIGKGKTPNLAIWSDHVGLAKIAKVYFEYLWKDAETLKK